MKTRRGFVSNSSSSSFVVAFNCEKPDAEYVRSRFGAVHYYSEYLDGSEMNTLIKDTLKQEPVLICEQNRELLIEKFFKGESIYYDLFYGHADREALAMKNEEDELLHKLWHGNLSEEDQNYIRGEVNTLRDKIHEYSDTKFRERIDAWIKENTGLYAFQYEYADDSGEGALEHGSHWNNVNVWVFSHH